MQDWISDLPNNQSLSDGQVPDVIVELIDSKLGSIS